MLGIGEMALAGQVGGVAAAKSGAWFRIFDPIEHGCDPGFKQLAVAPVGQRAGAGDQLVQHLGLRRGVEWCLSKNPACILQPPIGVARLLQCLQQRQGKPGVLGLLLPLRDSGLRRCDGCSRSARRHFRLGRRQSCGDRCRDDQCAQQNHVLDAPLVERPGVGSSSLQYGAVDRAPCAGAAKQSRTRRSSSSAIIVVPIELMIGQHRGTIMLQAEQTG
jgi:hypothetical protein